MCSRHHRHASGNVVLLLHPFGKRVYGNKKQSTKSRLRVQVQTVLHHLLLASFGLFLMFSSVQAWLFLTSPFILPAFRPFFLRSDRPCVCLCSPAARGIPACFFYDGTNNQTARHFVGLSSLHVRGKTRLQWHSANSNTKQNQMASHGGDKTQLASKFGAVLDMVTDRCSTAGLLMVLSRLYKERTYAHMFLLLMFIDLFSHWMHVQR